MSRSRVFLGAMLAVFAVMASPTAAALPGNGRVAVISGEFGDGRIWLVQPDGSGATLLTSQPVRTDAQWSPDGARVAFTGTDGDFNDVFAIKDDGTGLLRLTNDGSICCPQWSPDGSQLLLSAMRVVNADEATSGRWQTASPAGGRPTVRGLSTARAARLARPPTCGS
jgi:Tol biopolymer transport system component